MTLFMTINSPENGKLNRKGNPKRAGIDIDNKLSFNKPELLVDYLAMT